MDSYRELSKFINTDLNDSEFKSFLIEKFDDLTEYNIAESAYIKSKKNGVELGFKNKDAVYDEDDKVIFQKGTPKFSHFNLLPESSRLFERLPFGINFNDKRPSVILKAGQPNQTNKGEVPILGKYLVDFYFIDDLIISFDYGDDGETIKFIQINSKNDLD
jgi:hypothetical protein